MQQEKEIAFDLMRCLASIAVVTIHVISPYRQLLNETSFEYWLISVSIDAFFRWAVPVFIMISGALLLNDNRPFSFAYYAQRRLLKVFIPFLAWSVFYAGFSGVSSIGFSFQTVLNKFELITDKACYYHLGFFYFFIPLYFIIPLLKPLVQNCSNIILYLILIAWFFATGFHLFYIDGVLTHKFILYSGYLVLGYFIWQRSQKEINWLIILLGIVASIVTILIVVQLSLDNNDFTVGRWLSYKTLNRVLIAGMVFCILLYCSRYLNNNSKKAVSFVSKYSLGLYFIHPIFLWPLKEYGLYFDNPLLTAICWVSISSSLALFVSWLLAKNKCTCWLVP